MWAVLVSSSFIKDKKDALVFQCLECYEWVIVFYSSLLAVSGTKAGLQSFTSQLLWSHGYLGAFHLTEVLIKVRKENER